MAGRRVIAIDIGRRRLRALEADVERDRLVVRRVLVQPLPESMDADDPARLGTWVGKTLREAGLARTNATIAISREHVVLKRLTLPSIEDHELPEMTRLALQRDLPFEPGGAVIDFACLSRTQTATTVIVAAAPGAVLANVRDAARAAGITVDRMSLRTLGTAALVATNATEGTESGVLAVDISGDRVEFSVIVDGTIRFSRAGEIPPGDDPKAIAAAVVTEARRTWMSYRIVEDAEDVRRAVFFGNNQVCELAAKSIGEILKIDTEVFDRHIRVDASSAEQDMGPVWPLAGLLLAPMLDRDLIDFLHPRKTPDVGSRKRQIVLGVVGLVLILVFAGITWAKIDLADRRASLGSLQNRSSTLLPKYLRYGRDFYKLAHLEQWESADADWLEHLSYVATLTPSSDRVVLDSWTGTLVFSGVKFDKKTKKFSAPKEIRIVVEGEAADRVTADDFRGTLVETESYDISTAGPDAETGRRLPWAFQYNLRTRDATPGGRTAPDKSGPGPGPAEQARATDVPAAGQANSR
jgi:Tfp pilus assembly PilM family ATPase